MKKNLTCVACPLGCQINVEYDENGVKNVTGNSCKRGYAYAVTEVTNPTRSLTTTLRVNGGIHPVVPVKTNKAIPKNLIFECMKIINSVNVDAPVEIGQVIIKNILDTGADIVATNND